MKIKVDKKEYEDLLKRVEALEKAVDDETGYIFENWKITRDGLYSMMRDFFETQCIVTLVKRNREEIIGEVKKRVMDNIFKEEEKRRWTER